MSNETDLDDISILKHEYERLLSGTANLDDCDNAIITVRHQKHITTHFGPLTAKNQFQVSLSQEQILNQANRFHPTNITRSQSINFQKSSFVSPFGGPLFNREIHLNRRPSAIRPSLIPIKIRYRAVNLQRALTFGSNADAPNQSDFFVPKYRPVRKLSIPSEEHNYVSQNDESTLSSLPVTMTHSFEPLTIKCERNVIKNRNTGSFNHYKCGICLNILSDCRVLDCLHTFCLECLYSIETSSQSRVANLKRNATLKSNTVQSKSFESNYNKIDVSNNNNCQLEESSKENERQMTKSSRAFGSNQIDRDTIAWMLKKCATEQQKVGELPISKC